jgi:ketosteroid isomerase-like protein
MSEAEHPNAALVRRLFGAFGNDPMAVGAALARDIVWRVPGNTVMSGEYHGRRDVVEFLRRTGLETGGTYRSRLHTVLADDDWAVAIYRASGRRNGIDLDVEQALVIRIADGVLKDVTAVPLDSAFERFWAWLERGEERRSSPGADRTSPTGERGFPSAPCSRALLGLRGFRPLFRPRRRNVPLRRRRGAGVVETFEPKQARR